MSSGCVSETQSAQRWLSFRNDSGEVVPAYAIVQLISDRETDTTVPKYLRRLRMTKPNSKVDEPETTFALNGRARGPVDQYCDCTFAVDAPAWARIESDSGDATWDVSDPSLDWVGQEWGPVDGRWDVNIDGKGFLIQGPPDLDNNRILVRRIQHDPNDSIPGGDCVCCPGCICYPTGSDLKTGCGALACLNRVYKVVGTLPFGGNVELTYDSGCIFLSDTFSVTICDTLYGTFYWKLTVAGTVHDSKLELLRSGTYGTDIPLVYYGEWYFNPLCGNTFGLKFDCSLPTTIAHSFPPRLCVNPVGTECTGCANTVSSACCVVDVPKVLTGTLTDSAHTTGLTGQTVTLTWTNSRKPAFGGAWYGTKSMCSDTYEFMMYCCVPAGELASLWRMEIASSNGNCAGGTLTTDTSCSGSTATSSQCDPFQAVFAVPVGGLCPCADGLPSSATITVA